MTKAKQLPSRSAFLRIAGAVIVLAIGLAAVTHADEGRGRSDRDDRDDRGIQLLQNISARLNVFAPDIRVRIEESNVRVSGAVVSATSTSGFTATTHTPALTFVVQTDGTTKFHAKGKGSGSLATIAVGDTIDFRGVILSGTTTSTMTVKASVVEDKTRHDKPFKFLKPLATTTATIKGTVSSVSITANTLVIVGKNATTTVSVSGATIKDEDGDALALSGVVVGSEAKVFGTMSRSTNVFAATKLVVDLEHDDDDRLRMIGLEGLIARLEALLSFLRSNAFPFQIR